MEDLLIRSNDIKKTHLLTTTTDAYFTKKGYLITDKKKQSLTPCLYL